MKACIRVSIIAFLMVAPLIRAQVPQLLNYQGRVSVGGTNFAGVAQFKFALVNATGATNYWSNDGTAAGQPVTPVPLTVANGLYSILLGDTTLAGMSMPVTSAAFAASDVRLRVWFNDGSSGFQQLTPDQRIAAVGYALVAANLDPNSDVGGQRLQVGYSHNLTGWYATIAGGGLHEATNSYATVSGGLGNIAGGSGATVGGGVTNTATGFEATIAGGELNYASATLAFVGGGYGNVATNFQAAVAGGASCVAGGTNSFVGGGYGNLAGGTESTVAGGELNGASGTLATIGGGYGNLAGGYASTIPGGYGNLASGAYSFAAGAGALATNYGSFVWSDASSVTGFNSSANNEFNVRSAGGVRFFANSAANVGVRLAPGANAWSPASDRNLKENFKPVDTRAVLAKLVATPVTEWNLISQDSAIRHIGPMAQDFQAAFHVGEDDRHISTTDADGVAFAAIQGLHQMVQEKDARIAELEKRLAGLEAQMQQLLPRTATGLPK